MRNIYKSWWRKGFHCKHAKKLMVILFLRISNPTRRFETEFSESSTRIDSLKFEASNLELLTQIQIRFESSKFGSTAPHLWDLSTVSFFRDFVLEESAEFWISAEVGQQISLSSLRGCKFLLFKNMFFWKIQYSCKQIKKFA